MYTNDEDDFELEVVDLKPDEVPSSMTGTAFDAGKRLLTRLRAYQVKVDFTHDDTEDRLPDEYTHDSDFYFKIDDIPADEIVPYTPPKFVQLAIHCWPTIRRKRFYGLSILMLALLFLLLAGSSPYIQTFSVSTIPLPITASADIQPPGVLVGFTMSNTGERVIWRGEIYNNTMIVMNGIATGLSASLATEALWQSAPAPMNCSSNQPQSIGTSDTIGHFPVWVSSSFEGTQPTILLSRLRTHTLGAWSGWAIPLKIGVKFNFIGPVTVTIDNLTDGARPFFSDSDSSLSTSITFNPRTSEVLADHFATRSITAHLAGAGCYLLRAYWPGGSWEIPFAAGR